MKTVTILFCLCILLLMAVPVSAEVSTITSVSPRVGFTDSSTTITIVGTNFNETSVDVKLTMNGQDNKTASQIISHNSTTIVCRIPTISPTGTWNLVVVNQDGSEVSKIDYFYIRSPISLSSVTPGSFRTNNASAKISVGGEGLSDISSMYLYNSEYSNITASSVSVISSTRVNGTFNLVDKSQDTYQVCVKDSFGTVKCGLSFKVTSDAVGSIDISSSPSGAALYLDGVPKGTTPVTVDELDVGTYRLILKKDGYVDWIRNAKVTDGATTSYTANLEVKTTAPTATVTTAPTAVPTTIVLTRKSTVTAPTPWPSDTPTPASPLGTLAVIGGIGLALVAIRRR